MSAPAPLRRSLALRFSLAALVPITGASLLIIWHLAVTTVNEIGRSNLLLAKAVRGQVEGFLREPSATLQALAAILESMEGASARSVEEHLDAAVASSLLLESVYVVGGDGRVKMVGLKRDAGSSREDFVGLDLSGQPFLRRALETRQPTWSETFLSILSGRVALALGVPLGEDLLLGSFDIDRLQGFTLRLESRGGAKISILDAGGAIIADPDPQVALRKVKLGHLELVRRGFAGEEATARLDLLGRDVIASVVRIQDTGWLVLATQDVGDAYHQVVVTGITLAGAVLATVGLALLFALTQSGRISRPLADLAEQTRQVAAGGYQFEPPDAGSLEMQELAESFRQMTQAIEVRERQLREGEEKYRLLFENAGDAIFVVQGDRMVFFNRRATELAGIGAEALQSVPWINLVYPADRDQLLARLQADREAESRLRTIEVRVVRPGGEERWAQLSSVPFSWEGRPASLNFARDITELKKLEAQALHAQKMEAVGTLAGGVAHDFNNLLQAIQGAAELAMVPGRDPAANRRLLAQIVKSSERGAELTRQLLTFSRKIESRRRPLDLNAVIAEAAKMLEHTLPKMIKIELDLDRRLRPVSADPGQLQQVLMNLAVNAGHAMAGSGTLRIATANLDLAERDAARPEVLPGAYAVITVSDTGAGIAEEHQARIFEPFFTTKRLGEGTGLGLSMVFGIVKDHEGHIHFTSAPGAGTTFTILLPCAGSDAPQPGPEAAPARPLAQGRGERILVVDDEETIRAVGAEILSAAGYNVVTAADGESAVRVVREGGGVDLVLLDMIMPGMGGGRCLQELLRIDPQAKVIVTSGYSPEGSGDSVTASGARGFVGKPFSVERLLAVISKALDEGGTKAP